MRFVLDNSVVMRLAIKGADHEQPLRAYADKVVQSMMDAGRAVVPALWSTEAASVLYKATKEAQISNAEVGEFLQLLDRVGIEISAATETPREILALATRHPKIGAYDATYLALAIKLRCPLATNDKDLAEAAMAEGVEIFLGGRKPPKKPPKKPARKLK